MVWGGKSPERSRFNGVFDAEWPPSLSLFMGSKHIHVTLCVGMALERGRIFDLKRFIAISMSTLSKWHRVSNEVFLGPGRITCRMFMSNNE